MDIPKRQPAWEFFADTPEAGVYSATQMDRFLTEEVLPALRQTDHALKMYCEAKTGKEFEGELTRFMGVPIRLAPVIAQLESLKEEG